MGGRFQFEQLSKATPPRILACWNVHPGGVLEPTLVCHRRAGKRVPRRCAWATFGPHLGAPIREGRASNAPPSGLGAPKGQPHVRPGQRPGVPTAGRPVGTRRKRRETVFLRRGEGGSDSAETALPPSFFARKVVPAP